MRRLMIMRDPMQEVYLSPVLHLLMLRCARTLILIIKNYEPDHGGWGQYKSPHPPRRYVVNYLSGTTSLVISPVKI